MAKENRKCFKCGSSSADPDVFLYRYPKPGVKNQLRCEMWAKYKFPDGPWSSTEFQNKLFSEHRMLCHKHFKHASFIDFGAKKLHRHAFPEEECNEASDFEPITPLAGSANRALMDISNTRACVSNIGDVSSIEQVTAVASTSKCNFVSMSNSQTPLLQTTNETITDNIAQLFDKGDGKLDKTKYYYNKSRKYVKRLCQLRKSLKSMKTKNLLRILADDSIVKKLGNTISPTFALLLQGQINNFKKKPQGRRWTMEDKIIALRLFKKSPTCYRLLRRLFCLPAPSSVKKLLSLFDMPPGINERILMALKKYLATQKKSDNEFIIMFDEMSIRKNLQYNKKTDKIDGFQDHGIHGRTSQEAVKALVFMIAGIRKPVKQPLAYYLSGANVTADRVTVLLKETLRVCFKTGLNISATVCDMGGTNRRALSSLGATEDHPMIKIDDKDIITLFDAPHLLKCFRNMFIKYNIKCKTDISSAEKCGEGIAKWSHIKAFYEVDSTNPNFVYAPSLRKEHLDPNTKQKMKVNLAAQVMSHTVAAGIYSKVAEGKLPTDAVVTADVLSNMDKLFDLVNSDTPDRRRGKPCSTNMSDKSPHSIHFKKMKKFFREIKFVGCPRPPPSVEGWIWSMNGIEMLWTKLKRHANVKSLATRRLQQDPLENLFGCIRGNCGSNANPITSAFVGGIKTAILSNLAHISTGNCEHDDCLPIITNFKNLISPAATNKCANENDVSLFFESTVDLTSIEDTSEDSGEMQACAYVCGYLIKNHTLLNNCTICKKIFLSEEQSFLHNFVENKEYYAYKNCLNYASKALVLCVEKCAIMINEMLSQDAAMTNLKKNITSNISSEVFDIFKSCSEHYEQNVKYVMHSTFHICVNRFCTLKNRKYAEDASRLALKNKLDILQNR